MILFTLGLIIGLLIACFIAILMQRFQVSIQRFMNSAQNTTDTFLGKEHAYIAGMSEDESSFAATLPIDKQVKIQ